MSIANRLGALVLSGIVLPSYTQMENRRAMEEMRHARAEIDNELTQIDRFAQDWSAWDDTYQFVQDHNQTYLTGNLETNVMFEQHLALMWFVDLSGHTVWGRALDPDQSMPKPHSTFPGLSLSADNPLLAAREPDVSLTGIMETPLGPMLVASRPIVTSHLQGPVKGYVIVGKLLDARRLTVYGERIGSRLSGIPAASLTPDSSDAHLLSMLPPSDIHLVVDTSANMLRAYMSLYDIYGHPVMLLTTEHSREFVLQGRQTLNAALMALGISGVILMGLIYVALRYYVTRPLNHLAEDLKRMGAMRHLAPLQFKTPGKGELASVMREVGTLLERILYLSQTDTLTGLPNRNAFMDKAAHALALARRHKTKAALLLLDLDGFKEVNETLGHEAGDRLLAAVTLRLKMLLLESDTLARFGGDEFMILAENLPAMTGAGDLSRRILDIFKQPVIVEDIRHGRGCSIGVSIFPDDGETIEDLLRMADIAMYRAKTSGGNTWRCHSESVECGHEKGPE